MVDYIFLSFCFAIQDIKLLIAERMDLFLKYNAKNNMKARGKRKNTFAVFLPLADKDEMKSNKGS